MRDMILQYLKGKRTLLCTFNSKNLYYDTWLIVEDVIESGDIIEILSEGVAAEQMFRIKTNNLKEVRKEEDEDGYYLTIVFKNDESLTIKS